MNTQYRKNLKAVAQACKDYTDKTKEDILWQVGEYSITTSDDNTTASTKTVPSGATRVKIKKIYGNTVKYNPSVASDTTVAFMKTLPDTVYTLDVSYVYGASEVSENLANPNELIANHYTIKLDGTQNTTDASTRGITDYIDVKDTDYFISFATNIDFIEFVYYDSNKDFISVDYSNNIVSFTHSIPSNAKYLRVGMQFSTTINMTQETINEFKTMLVKGSTAPTTYKPYYSGIHNLELSGLKVEGYNVLDIANVTMTSTDNWNVVIDYDLKAGVTYTIATFDMTNGIFSTGVAGWQNIKNRSYTFTPNENGKLVVGDPDFNWYNHRPELRQSKIILVKGSTTLTSFEPYVSTTKTIDLSTILYNGNPLFEGNSLKAVNDVKDILTPYKATKKLGVVDLGSITYAYAEGREYFYSFGIDTLVKSPVNNFTKANILSDKYETVIQDNIYQNLNYGLGLDMVIAIQNGGLMMIVNKAYTDAQTFKTAMSGVYLVYELDTPIEVNIDWSATLCNIQGYPNGSIILQNTYNMDTANTITYNSIIKENCCSKIVQSRGGSVVKTINLPTTASDGYSAGSVNNYRDLTTNKRGTNVGKGNMGDYTYSYNESLQWFSFTPTNHKYINNATLQDCLVNNYTPTTYNSLRNDTPLKDMYIAIAELCALRDLRYDNATTFKTAKSGEPLYYELADASKTETSIDAVDNIIEVQPNDVLSFYDSNDNLVTVPSDLTYRIEVAR